MGNSPLLSVVTAARNAASTVRRCAVSVRESIPQGGEYILADGLSSDSTCEIVRDCVPSVRILSGRDGGVYDAMNKGLRAANGIYVSCLNADDFYLPGAVSEMLEILALHPETDILHGNILVNGREVKPPAGPASFGGARIFHPAAFIRKSLLEKCGFFDCRYSICADLDFFLKAHGSGAVFRHADFPVTNFALGGLSTVRRTETAREVRCILSAHGFPFWFVHGQYAAARLRAFAAAILKN